MKNPIPRSITRRRDNATEARKSLRRYSDLTTLDTDTLTPDQKQIAHINRVKALLWAQARIESALWLETSGELGYEASTPRQIAARITLAKESV